MKTTGLRGTGESDTWQQKTPGMSLHQQVQNIQRLYLKEERKLLKLGISYKCVNNHPKEEKEN